MDEQPSDEMSISRRLYKLVEDAEDDVVTLRWVLAQLHERAFGLFLLILALPCCVPFLYGIPQIVALPLMFVSAQILSGRSTPWLPERLAAREISKQSLRSLADRAKPWLERAEALSRPRFGRLTHPPLDRCVGVALVLFSASILVPLPGTNTVPGFAVVLIAIGLLQRDGIIVVLGTLIGTTWIATLIIAGATLASLLKGWLSL